MICILRVLLHIRFCELLTASRDCSWESNRYFCLSQGGMNPSRTARRTHIWLIIPTRVEEVRRSNFIPEAQKKEQ